jgi:hypothetical protein
MGKLDSTRAAPHHVRGARDALGELGLEPSVALDPAPHRVAVLAVPLPPPVPVREAAHPARGLALFTTLICSQNTDGSTDDSRYVHVTNLTPGRECSPAWYSPPQSHGSAKSLVRINNGSLAISLMTGGAIIGSPLCSGTS